MQNMTKGLIGLAALSLISCAADSTNNNASDDKQEGVSAPIALTVTDGGLDGALWQLDIESVKPLTPETQLYALSRSENDYRSQTWTAQSGADFTRKDGFDTITVSAQNAQISFAPHTTSLPGTYTPFINFSDGGTAVFLGQFDMFSVKDAASLVALEGDVTNNTGALYAAPLTLNSKRPMLYAGMSYSDTMTIQLDGKASYAFLGDTPVTKGQSFSGVIDPGLPDWIGENFDDDLSEVFSALAERWGFPLQDMATILLAFEGYDVKGISLTGGALPGNMIVMQLSGDRLKTENPRVTSYLKWFFTHEAVHLFQKKTDKSYAHNRFSWINEGGANTMTSMIMTEYDLAQEGYLLSTYSNSFALCAAALDSTTLEAAINAGPDGNYDCGDIIGRITDAALPDHDYFAFWNIFLDDLSGNFTDVDYFNTMRKLGADEAIVARLEALTQSTVTNAHETLRALMDDVGIKTTFVDKTMTAIAFPD